MTSMCNTFYLNIFLLFINSKSGFRVIQLWCSIVKWVIYLSFVLGSLLAVIPAIWIFGILW